MRSRSIKRRARSSASLTTPARERPAESSPSASSTVVPPRSGNIRRSSTSRGKRRLSPTLISGGSALDQAEVPIAALVEDGDLLRAGVPEHEELLPGSLDPEESFLGAHRFDRETA